VKDGSGQKVAYVYYEEEPGRRSATCGGKRRGRLLPFVLPNCLERDDTEQHYMRSPLAHESTKQDYLELAAPGRYSRKRVIGPVRAVNARRNIKWLEW